MNGIPFPVHAEVVETQRAKESVSYITEVSTNAVLLLGHLHLYPVCLEGVLVTYTLPGAKGNLGPNLQVIVTTNYSATIPIEVSYLWWLDPTCIPLDDYQQFLTMLGAHSQFPIVPVIKPGEPRCTTAGAPISTWLEPRKQLQKAIRQHRAFLRLASDYPSMTVEGRADFLLDVELIKGSLDEWPT